MKKYLSYLSFIAVALLSIFVLSACARQQVELIDSYNDKVFTNKYLKDVDVKDCEYEMVRIGYGPRGDLSLGPTDPRYRGIIHVSDDVAKELFDSYEWWEVTEHDDINLGNINLPDMDADRWYTSSGFVQENLFMVHTQYLYFNGKDTIIFDVQTF